MPTLTHSENNSLTFDDSSPAKTVTGWASIDAGANAFYEYVNVQISVAFGGSADGDATIKVRTSSNSGTTDDTESLDFLDVAVDAGNTSVVSFQLRSFNYVDIGVYNGNTAVEDITLTGIWEGLKISDDT